MVSGVVVAGFVGSKPGAGPHHLLPFLPSFAYLACRAYAARPAPGREGVVAIAFVALMFTHGPSALKQLRSIGGLIVLDQARERLEAEEVVKLTAAAPDAVMGQGGNDGYRATYHRVQTAFHGTPAAMLEVPAFMEMEKAGAMNVPDVLVTGCTVRHWIIPNAGAPFTLSGTYVHDRLAPILSDAFRQKFLENYRAAAAGDYFTLWRCVHS